MANPSGLRTWCASPAATPRSILASVAVPRLEKARAYVERLLSDDAVVYGVTTGFGKFAEVRVAGEDALALQRNLVFSHCCGVGEPLGPTETRAMMLLGPTFSPRAIPASAWPCCKLSWRL